MADFEGKVVVVTGSSSGMGYATAVELGRQGATVICAARREDRGEKTVAAIRAAGGDGDYVRTDIGIGENVEALFAFIAKKYGRLDGAFNNAAMEIDTASLPDIPLHEFDDMVRVNIRGTFNCLQHEMRMMRGQKQGAIVNTSSVCGVLAIRQSSAYVASKHAVVGMTKAAALDGAEFGVRVNVICPGPIDTEMMLRWTKDRPEAKQHMANFSPMKRVGTPQEIAEAVVWLLSGKSSYVTGLVMSVDGGTAAGLAAGLTT